MKRSVNLEDVAMVARRLKALETHFVFTGGSVVALLLDRPALTLSRPTKDVDVIAEVVTRIQYTNTAPCFLATKIEAFKDRGDQDYMASHDIEDIMTVVDGRERLNHELQGAPDDLRFFVARSVAGFLADGHFLDSLPGHLPPDPAEPTTTTHVAGAT